MSVPTTRSSTDPETPAVAGGPPGTPSPDTVVSTVEGDAAAVEQRAVETAVRADAPASPASLDRSLVMGIAWTGGVKWATQIISWCSTIIIARLLSPADYGIMGMAMVYVNFVALVNEFGLTAAILRNRDLNDHQVGQLGGFGVLIGVAFTIVSLLLAHPISWFYGNAAVAPVITLLSLNFTVSAIGVLPRALMARDLEFQRLASIDGISSLSQIAITVILAWLGYRYYSLVFSSLAATLIGTVVALTWKGHKIALPYPFDAIRRSLHIGWHVMIGRVAWYAYQNADFAIVGRVLGTVVLGTYTIGWEVATVPVERVSALVGQVTPSIFANIQHDLAGLRRYYLGVVGGIALLTFPAAIGIAMTADLLVPTVLGEKWIPAIVPLQLLAGYAGIRSIDTVTPQALVFTGNSRTSMWVSIWAAMILPVLFYVGTRWGAGGVAAMWVVSYPIVVFPGYRVLFRVLDLSPKMYFGNLMPALSGSAVMATVLLLARPWLHHLPSPKLGLVVEVLLGVAVYLATLWILYRERVLSVLSMIRRLRG